MRRDLGPAGGRDIFVAISGVEAAMPVLVLLSGVLILFETSSFFL